MLPKFRGWDTKRKKMWSPEEMGNDQLTLSPDGKGFINVSGTDTRLSHYLPHLIPLQFIELPNKNSKEIYEGDILRVTDPNGDRRENLVVQWDEKGTAYPIDVCLYEFDVTSIGWAVGMGYEFEVIGNVYENPELLEVKNVNPT